MAARPLLHWLALVIWFASTIGLAAAFFPKNYDWRQVVISSLDSPRDNPRAYPIACASLVGTGVLLWPFAELLRQRLAGCAPRTTRWAGRLFRLGALCLILTALLVPGHYEILGLGRVHGRLAELCGAAFSLAMLLYFAAAQKLPRKFRWLQGVVSLITVVPVIGFVATRLIMWAVYLTSPPQAYDALKASLWCSLSLWEWIATACLFSFLGLTTLALNPQNVVSRHREN